MTAERYIDRIDAMTERHQEELARARARNPDHPGGIGWNMTLSAPDELRRPVPAPVPYPVEMLGPVLGPACQSLQHAIQAPDAICGASLLAAASLCTQGHGDVQIDGRRYPLTIWTLSVAASGERKSAVDEEVMRPVREQERILAAATEALVRKYESEMVEWDARRAGEMKRRKEGVGLAAALEALPLKPQPPLAPKLTASDFTAEGLTKLLEIGMPSMGAFTDEAAQVFGGHGMTKETVARTAAALSKLWDNGTLDRVRVGDGATRLQGRRLAMHLMGQPVIVERALSDEVLVGQGFMARCLLAWPDSTMGTRLYRQVNLLEDAALVRYNERAKLLLSRDLPVVHGSRNELDPPQLKLSPDAYEVWRTFHDRIELGMARGGAYSTIPAWASKAPAQAARIAGVLTLFEDPGAVEIDTEAMTRAAMLADWHLGEAVRLAGMSATPPEIRNAEALLKWAHEHGHARIYSTMALNRGPACIRDRNNFRQAVAELERAGWACAVDGGAFMDGSHRRQVWDVRPRSLLTATHEGEQTSEQREGTRSRCDSRDSCETDCE